MVLLHHCVRAGAGSYYQDRYVQDERYFAIEHMEEVRPLTVERLAWAMCDAKPPGGHICV